jgi:hypothetical protein
VVADEDGALGRKLVADMERITLDRIGHDGFENAKRNRAFLTHGLTLRELRGETRENLAPCSY